MLHPIFRAIICITKKPEYEAQNPITFPILSRKYWGRKSTDKKIIEFRHKIHRVRQNKKATYCMQIYSP